MAVVSHSVANPTFGTQVTLQDTRPKDSSSPYYSTDIYGKKVYDKAKLYGTTWESVLSSSKIPDFKEQDFIRTKTLVQKRDYYSASKMTYNEARTKAQEVVSYGVTESISGNPHSMLGSINKNFRGTTLPWTNITNLSSVGAVAVGEFTILASSNSSTWGLNRNTLWFDIRDLPNHVSYSAAYLDIYVPPSAFTVTDTVDGWGITVYRWTGQNVTSTTDFNDFDASAKSSAFMLTGSNDHVEGYNTTGANRIPLDGTLFTWLNENPSGSNSQILGVGPIVGLMIRPNLDCKASSLDDPTGVNEIPVYAHSNMTYAPRLVLEYNTPTVPGFKGDDNIQRIGDHDGTALDVNDVVKIEGALSNIPNSNHNIIGKYNQSFLGQANRGSSSNWQVAVSSSGVDEANSEITLVNQTNGWNFKIKKKSLGNLTGSLLNFNKIID